MAVIFAVVGGGAVLGIDTSPDYGDYGDHSDHSDYSNYSDEAERRQRRIEDKKREINSKKSNVNTYKTQSVNSYLQSSTLREESGVTVNLAEVRRDGDKKISKMDGACVGFVYVIFNDRMRGRRERSEAEFQ